MPRMPAVALARPSLLLTIALLLTPSYARAESGGPPELAPGRSSERHAATPMVTRATRRDAFRALAATQAAELDSLGALAATSPAEAGRWQREIEAAKRRHAREEIVLQQGFALRTGNAALARRLALRLERLELASGGAR